MKATTISGALLALAVPAVLANPVDNLLARGGPGCNADNCLRAIRGREVGYDFCYSTLGRITTTTNVITAYTTDTTTVTDYIATATVYATTVTTVVLPHRDEPRDLIKRTDSPAQQTASIIKACTTSSASISSACSCYLGDSTSTITEETTTTVPVTVTETDSETLTVEIPTFVVTSTCHPLATPVLRNGGFDSGKLEPWTIGDLPSDSQAGSYSFVPVILGKVFKAVLSTPTHGNLYSKVDLVQNLVTCPGVKYELSFWYRFDGRKGSSTDIEIFIDGTKISDINDGTQSLFGATFSKKFIATSTTTVLEVDLVLGHVTGTETIYLDGFSVLPVLF
ncbi:hypothetical protein TWF694_004716 [Orbilia ellipsospora]|uniref:CBM-cenC domain-containing protein n=1 Tax=Orbilia ellipsospora TaxID=2528407 RepID=A0AAV9WVW8_9PEZI